MKKEGIVDVVKETSVKHRKNSGYYGKQRCARLVIWGKTEQGYDVWLGTIEGGLDTLSIGKKEKIVEWFLSERGNREIIGKEVRFEPGEDRDVFFTKTPINLQYDEIMQWAEKKVQTARTGECTIDIDDDIVKYLKKRPELREKRKKRNEIKKIERKIAVARNVLERELVSLKEAAEGPDDLKQKFSNTNEWIKEIESGNDNDVVILEFYQGKHYKTKEAQWEAIKREAGITTKYVLHFKSREFSSGEQGKQWICEISRSLVDQPSFKIVTVFPIEKIFTNKEQETLLREKKEKAKTDERHFRDSIKESKILLQNLETELEAKKSHKVIK